MKYLYNKQRIRRSKRKMSNLKRVLLSLMICGATVSWAKEFKMMTYNIYGARLTNGQKLGESIKPYAPDFISLQEVDKFTKRSNFRDVTSDIAKVLGYDYYFFKKSRDYDGGEYGISFISKYPLEKIYTYELPSEGEERRQLVVAELSKKTFGRWMGVLGLARYKKDFVSIKKDVTLGLNLLKKQIKDGNKDEVTDEEFEYANNYLKILKHEIEETKKQLYYLQNKSNNDIFNVTKKQYFN